MESAPKGQLYFEEHGRGRPLILLHGNGDDHHIFDKVVPLFAENYRVIAVDSRGHGQSTGVSKGLPLHYADMAEDVYALMGALKLERPILYGFSDGGIIGLLLAIRHPGALSALAVSGANTEPGGIIRGPALFMRLMYFFTRSKKIRLMIYEPGITPEELAGIGIPVLILAGSRDLIRREHTEAFAAAIPGAELRILDGETHGSYVVKSKKLYAVLEPWLRGR